MRVRRGGDPSSLSKEKGQHGAGDDDDSLYPTRDGHIAGDRAGLAQETALDRDRCLAQASIVDDLTGCL
jgi:hypothetical protein